MKNNYQNTVDDAAYYNYYYNYYYYYHYAMRNLLLEYQLNYYYDNVCQCNVAVVDVLKFNSIFYYYLI